MTKYGLPVINDGERGIPYLRLIRKHRFPFFFFFFRIQGALRFARNLTFNHTAIQWRNMTLRAFSPPFPDINECVEQSHDCGPSFECVNTQGSFRCNPKPQCAEGFERDVHGNCLGKKNTLFLFWHDFGILPPLHLPPPIDESTAHLSAIPKCANAAWKISLWCIVFENSHQLDHINLYKTSLTQNIPPAENCVGFFFFFEGAQLDLTQVVECGGRDRGVKCHTDRRSERLL